jgi:hypothetical protein
VMKQRFSVRPEPKAPKIEVYVYPTYKALRASATADAVRMYRKVLGYTVSFEKPVKGVIAQVHLCEKALSAEIVSHEAAHAVLGFAQYKGFHSALHRDFESGKPACAGEERFCYALGKVVQDITTELWDRGYYGRRPEKETKG